MSHVRPQYHFRLTDTGLDAWSVERLIDLSEALPVTFINPADVREVHINHWYQQPSDVPTPQSIIEHVRLINACDIHYPIILDSHGRVMDGMHRVCRAIIEGIETIPARRFTTDPAPDYVNCDPDDLPYL